MELALRCKGYRAGGSDCAEGSRVMLSSTYVVSEADAIGRPRLRLSQMKSNAELQFKVTVQLCSGCRGSFVLRMTVVQSERQCLGSKAELQLRVQS